MGNIKLGKLTLAEILLLFRRRSVIALPTYAHIYVLGSI